MERKRVQILVEVDLDPVPGACATPQSWQQIIERRMTEPWYNPSVSIGGPVGAAVTPTPQETCEHGFTSMHGPNFTGSPMYWTETCPGPVTSTPEAATEPDEWCRWCQQWHSPRRGSCGTAPAYRATASNGAAAMKCIAVANIRGEHVACDLDEQHDGWAHSNREHLLLWGGPACAVPNGGYTAVASKNCYICGLPVADGGQIIVNTYEPPVPAHNECAVRGAATAPEHEEKPCEADYSGVCPACKRDSRPAPADQGEKP